MKRNFTLIELVVVVGVLSLFTVLLSSNPVLGKARSLAGTGSCVNNLKQIGAAIEQYRTDNNGNQPLNAIARWNEKWGRLNNRSLVALLVPYVAPGMPDPTEEIQTQKWVFSCPADTRQTKYWLSSYGASGVELYPNRSMDIPLYIPYGEVKNPATAFALMDGTNRSNAELPAAIVWSPRSRAKDGNGHTRSLDFRKDTNNNGILDSFSDTQIFNGADLRHDDRANMLFVDAHVDSVDEAEFVKLEHWEY